MAIGIDFVLRATTAGFTKGIAQANNSIHDLKKNLKVGDVGNGLKQLFGAGAIIQGFRTAINHAQELRTQMESIGHAVDPATASVARLGDSLDAAKLGLQNLLTSGLSQFTRAGEMFGSIINQFRFGGYAGGIEDISEKTARAADDAVKRRDAAAAARIARNTPEALKKLREDQKAAEEARLDAQQTKESRVNMLLQQQLKLREELSALLSNPDVVKNDPAAISAKNIEIQKKGAQIDAASKVSDDAQLKLIQAQTDAFLPSIEDLALFQGGTNTGNAGQNAKGAAAAKAREYFNLQMQSRAAYQNGDLAGALSLSQKADQARFGLLGSAKSDEVNKGKELLDTTNKSLTELEQINKAINGIFVVPGK